MNSDCWREIPIVIQNPVVNGVTSGTFWLQLIDKERTLQAKLNIAPGKSRLRNCQRRLKFPHFAG